MTDTGQQAIGSQNDPPGTLIDAVRDVLPAWLERCVIDTATRQTGSCPPDLVDAARRMAGERAPEILEDLRQLFAADVDAQRSNPLSVLRAAVAHPTAVLQQAGIEPVLRDEFERNAFTEDHYRLVPATWADVDPSLQEPGIMWGAWKASVVLRRRRAEGRR